MFKILFSALAAVTFCGSAQAQTPVVYPSKPIKIVVPFPAGGTSVGSSAGRVAKPSLRGGRFGQRGDDSAGGCARVAGHFT